MKLYVGSRDIKPNGFKSVDIDSTHNPDIVADITNMPQIESGSCSEITASHVLEHLEWPDSFKAIAEMARVLKKDGILNIAVPDLKAMLELMNNGGLPFFAVGMIFGSGGRYNKFEQHRYGFTAEMLIDILQALGFSDFNWWGSTLPEGANGWLTNGEEKIAVSLNITAKKTSNFVIDANLLYSRLLEFPMKEFKNILGELLETAPALSDNISPLVYQQIHFQLIEARQRIAYLEEELSKAQNGTEKEDLLDG